MNKRYGQNVSDKEYMEKVIHDAQVKIDGFKDDCAEDDCYSEDGMKEIIVDWMDELYIYPEDIDFVISKLDF